MKLRNVVTVDAGNVARLRALIDKHGTCQAASFLGISRHALERAAGGLTVHKGTDAYLAQKIAERNAAGKDP
jgi:hypothetical protein